MRTLAAGRRQVKKRDDGQPSAKLGVLIEERRRAAGLTQRALAERSGVSVGAIRDLEQGRTGWPRRLVLR